MGPMRAACRFASLLRMFSLLDQVTRVRADLYGSLALTGIGHGTDRAVILGLAGEEPSTTDPATMESQLQAVRTSLSLPLAGTHEIAFQEADDLLVPSRSDDTAGCRDDSSQWRALCCLRHEAGKSLLEKTFFSIGGGFIVEDGTGEHHSTRMMSTATTALTPFSSAAELLAGSIAASKRNHHQRFGDCSNETARRSGWLC